MKKYFYSFLLLLLLAATPLRAQQPVIIQDSIVGSVHLTADKIYLIRGFVYIVNGATLTIDPGTLLWGEKSTKGCIIAERGGKLIAKGTAQLPIIFTSAAPAGQRAAGDWGGVILCGKAPINQNNTVNGGLFAGGDAQIEGGPRTHYGGTDPHDNSGDLEYVRIEFPGIPLIPNSEINGLTFGGVGDGTIIDHIQVSYSGDDNYEWFGGTVNCKHLIGFKGLDDDWDTDFGFSGSVQFGVSLRDPNIADISQSNGFESDNDNPPNYWNPRTRAIFCNMTVVGPQSDTGKTFNPLFGRGAHIRRNSELNIYNSVVMGWPTGLLLDAAGVVASGQNDTLQIRNCIWAGLHPGADFTTNVASFDAVGWFKFASYGNTDFLQPTNVMLKDPFNLTAPNFTPQAGSAVLTGWSFTNARLGSFFDKVNYRGAFGPGPRWDSGWTNYDPQNGNYVVPRVTVEASHDFTLVNVNQSVTQTIDIVNSGNTDLAISGFTITGPDASQFVIVGGGTQTTVPPAGKQTVSIKFTPTSIGVKTAKLTFSHNTPGGSSIVALTGKGIIVYGQDVLKDSITGNVTLTNDRTWLIRGFVYIVDGAILNIEPGTVIYGEKATKGCIIAERGGKLIAKGTEQEPIVFLGQQAPGQRAAGDWGGIILCGKAPINQNNTVNGGLFAGGDAQIEGGPRTHYGGTDPHDNSGDLEYVRIEFPGIPLIPNSEINGLTFGGVGDGTIIDHIQVSYSGDDNYEWFGGTVNCKHLIGFKGLDDDWDTDFGFSGSVQFGVSLRDPNIADISQSNGFESDNDNPPNYWNPRTRVMFSNMTVVGPQSDTGKPYNPLFGRGAHIRRNSELSVYNSIFMGWPTGLLLDASGVANAEKNDTAQIQNTIWAGLRAGNGFTTNVAGFDAAAWYHTPAYNNSDYVQPSDVKLTDPFNQSTPNFTPMTGSPALTGASFTNPRLSAFEQVSYRGAFGPGPRWDSGWTNYDPQNLVYSPKPTLGVTAISFGSIAPNATKDTTVTAVLTNTGNVVLGVANWGLTDSSVFTVVGGNAPFAIKAGASKQITLRFHPTTEGTFNSKLQFYFVTKEQVAEVSISGSASSSSGVDEVQQGAIQLFQNTPNPVSGNSTNISFSLQNPEFVNLALFDITGKPVATLLNSLQTEGMHSVTLNTSGLSEGLYLYRLNAGKYSLTKRLVIVR